MFLFNYTNKYYQKKINKYFKAADGLMYLDERNPRYFDYSNSLSLKYAASDELILQFNIANDLYDKSIYFPYYDSNGEVISTAHPVRFDLNTALHWKIRNHLIHFGVEYAKETYKAFNIKIRQRSSSNDCFTKYEYHR